MSQTVIYDEKIKAQAIPSIVLLAMLVRFLEKNATMQDRLILLPLLEKTKTNIYAKQKKMVSLKYAAMLWVEEMIQKIEMAKPISHVTRLPEECQDAWRKHPEFGKYQPKGIQISVGANDKEKMQTLSQENIFGGIRSKALLDTKTPIIFSPLKTGNTIEITVDEYSGQYPDHWCRWQRNNEGPQTINSQKEVFIKNVSTEDVFTFYGEGMIILFEFPPEMAEEIILLKTVQYQNAKPKTF